MTNSAIYSDFPTGFTVSPINGALTRVINASSIRQSIRNLLLTNRGERPFQPDLGTDIRSLLFEEYTVVVERELDRRIRYVIDAYEPRVYDLDIKFVNHDVTLDITLSYSVVNIPDKQQMTMNIKRIR
jgi:phage baseplate assembly protein W